MKSIKIPIKLHQALKLEATRRGISLTELVTEVLGNFIRSLTFLLVFFMVGCATQYTQVDTPNEMRYRHDQKMERGLEMKTVMNKFGSPTQVKRAFYRQRAIMFIYRNAIFCQSVACFVYFDPSDKEVFHFVGFRQEYTNDITY